MLLHHPKSTLPARYWWHAENGAIFKSLHAVAQSGKVDAGNLDQIRQCRSIHRERELRYYLASLYLLIGQFDAADELLGRHKPGSEMKRYYAVLSHCRKNSLPMPRLNPRQEKALANIDERLRQECSLVHRIEQAGGFSIIGNAPASHILSQRNDLCTFYFNEYQKNPAIEGVASVHVVTPSWQDYSVIESDALLLSGNNVFFRRSRVWERFYQTGCIAAIYTAPRTLWKNLTATLCASPTAGLLVLNWISHLLRLEELSGRPLERHIDGFSLLKPETNHSYNREKLSDRHNWELEPQLTAEIVATLLARPGIR